MKYYLGYGGTVETYYDDDRYGYQPREHELNPDPQALLELLYNMQRKIDSLEEEIRQFEMDAAKREQETK
jgi:hypothetical protein